LLNLAITVDKHMGCDPHFGETRETLVNSGI
jgi:hypothetical protein